MNALIERELGRPIVVIGAAIESDAHTVGIDAIMNMKGFAGDYGLERYPWIEAVNLGAQVPCERVLREAQERSADAILVSQVVTQKQVHARQLTKLVDLLEAEGVRDRYVLVCGGPRLSNTFAKELGYDAGFGPGSTPSTVAGWIAQELVARKGGSPVTPELDPAVVAHVVVAVADEEDQESGMGHTQVKDAGRVEAVVVLTDRDLHPLRRVESQADRDRLSGGGMDDGQALDLGRVARVAALALAGTPTSSSFRERVALCPRTWWRSHPEARACSRRPPRFRTPPPEGAPRRRSRSVSWCLLDDRTGVRVREE